MKPESSSARCRRTHRRTQTVALRRRQSAIPVVTQPRRLPAWCVSALLLAAGDAAFASVLSPTSAFVAPVSAAGVLPAQSAADEPDDRLSRSDERLVRELTKRYMPELVAELLAGHPPAHAVYVAQAFAQAAVVETDPALKEQFYESASREYRRLIALENDTEWLRGLRRKFNITQWRIELADLLLQHWIAADLDRYEITSGIDYDRVRLTRRLREAHDLYAAAGPALDAFLVGLRTEEERYLLLGLGDSVTLLHEQRRLNASWAALYWAMSGETDETLRPQLLASALSGFDGVSRSTRKPERKYIALLGAGVTLRESGRGAEAEAAFDRIGDSTAPAALVARAAYEKARLYLQVKRFEEARKELAALEARPTAHLPPEEAGAVFYVRLAPLLTAYSFALEAKEDRAGPAHKEMLQQRAVAALTTLSEQGGPWPEIVRVYLDAVAGTKRSLAELTPTELRITAGRQMAEKDHRTAIETLRVLLGRPEAAELHTEARFDLGVCLFHTQDLRAAAETFLAAARENGRQDLAERSAEYAYRCWRQIARESGTAQDYLLLAEAGETLARRHPDHERALEAAWVSALARQEAGDYDRAASAYAEIAPTSPHYWEARRNIARCRQRIYEALSPSASAERKRRLARVASSAWLRLADDLVEAPLPATPKEKAAAKLPGVGGTVERNRWVEDARLSAAALLATEDIRAYQESLAILEKMPVAGRVVALRIVCYRGLGDREAAQRVLDDFLGKTDEAEIGAAMMGLAAEMEAEINRLRGAGQLPEAARVAKSSIPTFRQLLDWIAAQPRHAKYVPVVRFSLAKALIQAGRLDEAGMLLDQLMTEDPGNGNYLRSAALLHEDLAEKSARPAPGTPTTAPGSAATTRDALDKAESFWMKLLTDPQLRDRAPAEYWEARYYWLRHQLRQGRAVEVLKGIETEKAWFPDLGGPPWQGRLLELAEQARTVASTNPAP